MGQERQRREEMDVHGKRADEDIAVPGLVVRRVFRKLHEQVRAQDREEQQHAVPPRLLGVMEEERVQRQQQRRDQPASRTEQPAGGEIEQGDGTDGEDGGQAPGDGLCIAEVQPEFQQQVIKPLVGLVRRHHPEKLVPRKPGEIDAVRLVEPDAVGADVQERQDRSQQGDGRRKESHSGHRTPAGSLKTTYLEKVKFETVPINMPARKAGYLCRTKYGTLAVRKK